MKIHILSSLVYSCLLTGICFGETTAKTPQDINQLIVAMKNDNGQAATELVKLGPINKEVVEAFICASDSNWRDVMYACDTFFTYLGPHHSYVMPDLMNMLKNGNERQQILAMTAIGNMGEAALPAVPLIVEKMKNPRLEETPFLALRKLGPYSQTAVPDLTKMLEDPHQRFSAAMVLEAIGPKARPAIPALEKCLGLNIKSVAFARALLAIDPNCQKAFEELKRIAESPYVANQWSEQPDAHYLLIVYNHDAEKHLQSLIDALHNSNSRIRLSAASYLAQLGLKAKSAIDSLKETMKDGDSEVRVEAARAILEVGSNEVIRKEAAETILDSLDNDYFMTTVRASEALQDFTSQEEWTVSMLIDKVNTDTRRQHVRLKAIRALGTIGTGAKEALPYLKRMTVNEDWPTRCAAKEAIEKINVPKQ